MTEQTPDTGDMDHTVELVPFRTRVELTAQQMGALMAPLSQGRVASRSQGGATLSYVEAWDIKACLIRVFGFGGFSAEVVDSKIVQIRESATMPQHANKDGGAKTPQVIAQSTVKLTIFGVGPFGQDAVYSETAIGVNSGWDIGDVADNAMKSASSDALKRCAIYLGTQFGLSLYNNGSREDVVRVILEPEQQAMLEAAREAVKEARAEQQQQMSQEQEAQVQRALGGRRIDTPEQTAEVIAEVVTDQSQAVSS